MDKNLIKIIKKIESNRFSTIEISLYGGVWVNHRKDYFEYRKELDVESIYYDGETWVVYTTKHEEYKLSEYGVKWKLWLDPDYDYEDFELYDLTVDETYDYLDEYYFD